MTVSEDYPVSSPSSGDTRPAPARQRRRLLLTLLAVFVLDTIITMVAIVNGAVEANPLYWVFHDVHQGGQAMLDALGVRITLGLAVFYWLHMRVRLELLRVICGGYSVLVMIMLAAHILARISDAQNAFFVDVATLIAQGVLIAALIVLGIIGVQYARVVWQLRGR